VISPKVIASTLGAAVASIVVWVLTLAGLDVPGEVGGAIATICAAVLGYVVPDRQQAPVAVMESMRKPVRTKR
jgi:hypothetical protein